MIILENSYLVGMFCEQMNGKPSSLGHRVESGSILKNGMDDKWGVVNVDKRLICTRSRIKRRACHKIMK